MQSFILQEKNQLANQLKNLYFIIIITLLELLILLNSFLNTKLIHNNTSLNIREDKPNEDEKFLFPINPYGKSKLFIEYMLKDTAKAHKNFKVTSLRKES